MDETTLKNLYQEFSRQVRPLFRGSDIRQVRDCDMKLWVLFGLAYRADEEGTSYAYYGLTEAGQTVRGYKQMGEAITAHRDEMERRRLMLAAERR